MNYRWYVLSAVFFVACAIAGSTLILISSKEVVCVLGALIAAFSIGGALVALWTFRFDDPWQFERYRSRISMFLQEAGSDLQTLTQRRRLFLG